MKEKKLKKRILRVTIFKRLLLASLVPCLIAIILMLGVFYPLGMKYAGESDQAVEDALCISVEQTLGSYYSACEDIAGTIVEKELIHDLFLIQASDEEQLSRSKSNQIKALLSQYKAKYVFVEQISIRMYKNPSILYTNNGVFYNTLDKQQEAAEQRFCFFDSETYSSGIFSVETDAGRFLVYCMPIADMQDGRRSKGEINIFLNESKLIADLKKCNAEAFRLCNYDGKVQWEYDFCKEGVSYTAVSRDVPGHKTQYTLWELTSLHNANVNAFKRIFIPVSILVILLVGVVAFNLSKGNYRSVSVIADAIRENEAGNDSKNPAISFSDLEGMVDSMTKKYRANVEQIDQLRPFARHVILGRILDGKAFLIGLQKDFREYGILFDARKFRVIAIENTAGQEESAGDYLMDRDTVFESVCTEQNEGVLQAYLYQELYGKKLVLLNYNQDEQAEAFVNALTSRSRAGNGEMSFHCGAGSTVSRIENAYISCEQAITALNYAVLNQTEEVVCWEEIEDFVKDTYSYTISDENVLSTALMIGNYEESILILKDIISRNLSILNSNQRMVKELYYDIRSTMARCGIRKGLAIIKKDSNEAPPKGSDDMVERLSRLADKICNNISSGERRKNEEILQYIQEHLYDCMLSLTTLASAFHISEAYISKMFKARMGVNYNDYVNRCRIEKAVELITNEHLNPSAVYRQVGYVSDSTFRRNFQKYTSNKPGQF